MHRYSYLAPLAICLCPLLAGCASKDLTRSRAAELVKENQFGPASVEANTRVIHFQEEKNGWLARASSDKVDDLRLLERAGWINLSVSGPSGTGYTYTIALTPSGKAEAQSWKKDAIGSWMVPASQPELIEITGITHPSEGMAVVEYTWHYVPTQAGKRMGIPA